MAGEGLFEDMLGLTRRCAVHLETRDEYLPDDPDFAAWRAGRRPPGTYWPWWMNLVSVTVARGVDVRRARIVSEPLSRCARFEYDITEELNLACGEDVRWLPRRRASDLALPGNDFWLFDDEVVVFNHFTGDGSAAAEPFEVRTEPAVIKLCTIAFDAVWERAVPHLDYRPD